jgi:hypothetical protein
MTIYGNRQRENEETERLKKAQRHETHKMTQAEKEHKAQEMIARAEALTAERKEMSGFQKSVGTSEKSNGG